VEIEGAEYEWGSLTPLISYLPSLAPFESAEIPFVVKLFDNSDNVSGQQSQSLRQGEAPSSAPKSKKDKWAKEKGFADCMAGGLGGVIDAVGNLEKIRRHIQGRIAGGYYCYADPDNVILGIGVVVTAMSVKNAAGGLTSLSGARDNLISCAAQYIGGFFSPRSALMKVIMGDDDFSLADPQHSSGKSKKPNERARRAAQQWLAENDPPCFLAGTAVRMADGSLLPIEGLTEGDVVSTGWRPEDAAAVSAIYWRDSDRVRELTFRPEDAEGEEIVLFATDDHLIWVDGKGWTLADAMQPGDFVFVANGRRAMLVSTMPLAGTFETFTLRLSGDNAFFADNILVHDMCGRLDGGARREPSAEGGEQ